MLGGHRRRSIPNSVSPTICRRARRRGRAKFWRCRGRRAVSPGVAVHAPPVAEERAWPLPGLPVRRSCRRGCTRGNRNRRRGHGWGGEPFVTTAARPGLSPRAKAGRVRSGRPLRQACRSHGATPALVFHASAASGDVRRRGLGTADYAASSFLSLSFTGASMPDPGTASRPGLRVAGGGAGPGGFRRTSRRARLRLPTEVSRERASEAERSVCGQDEPRPAVGRRTGLFTPPLGSFATVSARAQVPGHPRRTDAEDVRPAGRGRRREQQAAR